MLSSCFMIYYERPDESELKISTYEIVELDVASAQKITSLLTKSLGIKIVVEKERNLWMYENTRIHLDIVQGLGCFSEPPIQNGRPSFCSFAKFTRSFSP